MVASVTTSGLSLCSLPGSSDAFSTLLAGDSQIGMSSRRIRPEEARACVIPVPVTWSALTKST